MLAAPDNGLDLLRHAGYGLLDHLKLIELHQVLTSERAEAEWRIAEVGQLEERLHAFEEESEALRVTPACVYELTAERTSLTTGLSLEMKSVTPWIPVFSEVEVAAATRNEKLGVVVWAVWLLKRRAAVREVKVKMAETQARETLYIMSGPQALVKEVIRTVGGDCAHIAELVERELIGRSIISAALLESEGTVSEAICSVCDSFSVEAFSDAPG